MRAEDLSEVLGLTSADPRLKAMLGTLGIRRKVRRRAGQTSAWLESPSLGIQLTFTPRIVVDIEEFRPGEGSLVLSNIRLSGDCDDPESNFKRFEGELPHGLEFGISRDEVRLLLGPPTMEDREIPTALWYLGPYWVSIGFDPDDRLREVTLQLAA